MPADITAEIKVVLRSRFIRGAVPMMIVLIITIILQNTYASDLVVIGFVTWIGFVAEIALAAYILWPWVKVAQVRARNTR